MVDCFAGAAIRDAISRDPMHNSFVWDLSQNVTRAPFRTATVGVSGCVTPGGELLMPHLGRTVMGYEKLLLQGIPFSRLVLGRESEVQLSDLAGNAMSTTVVGATILAVIAAPYLREQRKTNPGISLDKFELRLDHDSDKGAVRAERGDLHTIPRKNVIQDLEDVVRDLANSLAADAFASSVLCTCESSGATTKDPKLLECQSCGMKVCHTCSDRYQVSSHELAVIKFAREQRPDPHIFERNLRNVAPSILRLAAGSETELKDGAGLESYSFQLLRVDRKFCNWQLSYGAWEDFGSGRQVAEVRVDVGRVGILSELGACAFIRCFAPAIRDEKPQRGKLNDSARLVCKAGQESTAEWETPDKPTKGTLIVSEDPGSERVPSQRALIGLGDQAAKDLRNQNVTRRFIPPIADTTRNPFSSYPKNWKEWPGVLVVSDDPNGRLNGRYKKMTCTHTVALSALWRREGVGEPMYLFFRPNIVRAALDMAVFSPSPSYKDGLEVAELVDWIPENAFEKRTHKTQVKFLHWKEAPELKVEVPSPIMEVHSKPASEFQELLVGHDPTEVAGPVLCKVTKIPEQVIHSLLEFSEVDGGTSEFTAIDLVGKAGTRNAKRLSIVAGPTLLKYAATGKLPLSFSTFYPLPSKNLGQDERYWPTRPEPRWVKKSDGVFHRQYDPEEVRAVLSVSSTMSLTFTYIVSII